MKEELITSEQMSSVIKEIKEVLDASRKNIAYQVNNELLITYWNIGRIICEHAQSMPERADYGKQTLKELARELTKEFGKGFSRSNLQNMRLFYLAYEKCQTLSGKLSWSHYCELLSISDLEKRSFYEKEAVNSAWSVRELKRQIESSLFERLLLSDGNAELSYRLSRGIAVFLGKTKEDSTLVFNNMKSLYNARSKFLHEGKENSKDENETNAQNYARELIYKLINMSSGEKKKTLAEIRNNVTECGFGEF